MDQVAKQSTIDRLAQATNVLVTVSANPSVDQLAACIGLTLFLNKQGKHATAVFSGDVPSTLEFLQPDKTIEKNTDSLRDFIISLDKSKADKLRYKVEDKVVKIFITPYRTSISEKDFDFSQGDFNVDVVVALGVHSKEELDQAIIAHGRILHDATIISINNAIGGTLGTINWQDQQASSLCEMLVELAEVIKSDSFDAQMATSFLTGIVAETKRFSNEKTTSRTMSLSAKLMAAGANQQLVASQLQSKSAISTTSSSDAKDNGDGTLEIDHTAETPKENVPPIDLPKPEVSKQDSPIRDVKGDNYPPATNDVMSSSSLSNAQSVNSVLSSPEPSRGGTLTANTKPEELSPAIDPLIPANNASSMQGNQSSSPANNNLGNKTISNIEDAVIDQDKTLSEIEQSVNSPHVENALSESIDAVRESVDKLAEPQQVARQDVASQGRLEVAQNPVASDPYGEEPILTNGELQSTPPSITPAPSGHSLSPIPPDAGLPPETTGTDSPPSPPPVPPPMTMPVNDPESTTDQPG